MLRTSYSQISIQPRLLDGNLRPDGRLIAQAEHVPIHVGALPYAAKAATEFFGDDIHQGDVFLLNDPTTAATTFPDLTAFVPVFEGAKGDGLPRFWSINRAHQSDIGGRRTAPTTPPPPTSGRRASASRHSGSTTAGKCARPPRDDRTNVRHPRDFRGDLAAMIGSAHVGERRPGLGGRVRLADHRRRNRGGARRRRTPDPAVIAEWQDGVYRGEAFLDDDGRGNDDIHIRATVTEARQRPDDRSHRLAPGHELCQFLLPEHALGGGCGAVLSDRPDTPKNDGTFRPITVLAKPGTVVWANPRAGHTRHEPLRARNPRGDHQGAGAGLPRSRHGRLGPPLPHRHPGQGPPFQ